VKSYLNLLSFFAFWQNFLRFFTSDKPYLNYFLYFCG